LKLNNVKFFFTVIFLFFLLESGISLSRADSLCKGSFINPLTDIRWEGIFPIRIAGVKIKGPAEMDNPDSGSGSVLCFCKQGIHFTIGINVSYWNPARIVETTKVPWCLPTLGIRLSIGDHWKHMGTFSAAKDMGYTFTNAHNLIFNVFDILNLFVDIPCVPHEGFDIAYFSELDPSWNSDLVAYFLNPEVLLFANPVSQLACVADSSAAVAGWPIDTLFWCAGGWGSVYPFSGHNINSDYTRGNALNMARVLYRNARIGVMWDTGIDECGAVITPVWVKSHFKVHQIKPVRGPIMPIGRPSVLWEESKNPPGGTSKGAADNFSWEVFKFVKCCMGYSE